MSTKKLAKKARKSQKESNLLGLAALELAERLPKKARDRSHVSTLGVQEFPLLRMKERDRLAITNGKRGEFLPAQISSKLAKTGISDIKDMTITWLAGYIYIGNGTLGQTDNVYFMPVGNLSVVYIGNIPVLPQDANVGQSYVADIEKHFSRKVVHSTDITVHALIPSTANSLEVLIAPIRGCTGGDDLVTDTGAATAALAYATVVGIQDVCQATSWQDMALRMSKHIAGGFGAKQNEFAIDSLVKSTSLLQDMTGVVPCGFAISGQNTSSGLRGFRTHSIVIKQRVSYLDFLGAAASANLPMGSKQFDFIDLISRRRRLTNRLTEFMRESSSSSDSKDVKSLNSPVQGFAVPTLSRIEPVSPTRSLLDAELRVKRASYFSALTGKTDPPKASQIKTDNK